MVAFTVIMDLKSVAHGTGTGPYAHIFTGELLTHKGNIEIPVTDPLVVVPKDGQLPGDALRERIAEMARAYFKEEMEEGDIVAVELGTLKGMSAEEGAQAIANVKANERAAISIVPSVGLKVGTGGMIP